MVKHRAKSIVHRPLVSVIIVSYNTKELTLRSIESVYASDGFKKGELEVIVVDNGSSDDTVNYLGSHLEQFRLIVNSDNPGFGAANNQGAAIARGRYLLFLNSDAFLHEDTLRVLVDTLEKHQDVYSTAPQLQYEDGRIQPSAGYFPTPLRVLGWMWGLDKIPLVRLGFSTPYHVFKTKWYTEVQSPDWLMGACMLFRASEFRKVLGFDEHIFMYAEEVDLYWRLQKKLGKKVLYNPEVSAIHLGRSSSQVAGTAVLTQEIRGIEYLYRKYHPSLLPLIRLIIGVGIRIRILLFSLLKNRHDSVLEYKKLL